MKVTETKTSRKSALKSMFAAVVSAGAGLLGVSKAGASGLNNKDAFIKKIPDQKQSESGRQPLFSSVVVHDGLVYVAGKGEHGEGDITVHTTSVLDQIQAELEGVGSSMEKVLKVNVYLHDMRDYDEMNAAYRGRFGDSPPVRSTVACYNGIPGNSLVEIDCIAAL
jgi:2-iminobutanoate/2-iminopropanoate deaminase